MDHTLFSRIERLIEAWEIPLSVQEVLDEYTRVMHATGASVAEMLAADEQLVFGTTAN